MITFSLKNHLLTMQKLTRAQVPEVYSCFLSHSMTSLLTVSFPSIPSRLTVSIQCIFSQLTGKHFPLRHCPTIKSDPLSIPFRSKSLLTINSISTSCTQFQPFSLFGINRRALSQWACLKLHKYCEGII